MRFREEPREDGMREKEPGERMQTLNGWRRQSQHPHPKVPTSIE